MTVTQLAQLAPSWFARWLEGRRLRAERAAMLVARDYFIDQRNAGLNGEAWVDKRLINIDLQLKDLQNAK